MKHTESFIHVGMRYFLKKEGWQLISGQFPGGSDDELYELSIVDPTVAKDNSPDPRRHSKDEIVPDLIAYKNNMILIVEAKPYYSIEDRDKLIYLLNERNKDLHQALSKFIRERKITGLPSLKEVTFAPVLAFSAKAKKAKKFNFDNGFFHIRVKNLTEAKMEGPFIKEGELDL
ncbi:hypothetical protein [Pseudalkalibacillus hwajinpoensis]|uniref:hypothetical protein n=1 Tax=Guptibacillus hwajinpoensis TaxID=208199 RepID=UPI001CFC9780|nr:hypothetical protein [Pseudalkalibacillus hwajinpoensis]